MYNHLELMSIQARVLYIQDHAGRITTINEPTSQSAPRFFWGKTVAGSIVRFHSDVPNRIIQTLNQGDSTEQLPNVIRALEKDREIRGLRMGRLLHFMKR